MSDRAHEALYNERILALAGGLAKDDRLEAPDATAQMDSPLCGSRIRVDVIIGPDGRIRAYGQQVRACALGQSAAAIVKAHAIGKSRDEMDRVRQSVEAMLKQNGDPPDGEWADIAVLQPARDHKSRHASILLPFKAVVQAMDSAVSGTTDD